MNWQCHFKTTNNCKNGQNGKKWPSTYAFNSSYNFRAREKFMKKFFVFKHLAINVVL